MIRPDPREPIKIQKSSKRKQYPQKNDKNQNPVSDFYLSHIKNHHT